MVRADVLFGRDILGPQRLIGWTLPFEGESKLSLNETMLRNGALPFCNVDSTLRKAALQKLPTQSLEADKTVQQLSSPDIQFDDSLSQTVEPQVPSLGSGNANIVRNLAGLTSNDESSQVDSSEVYCGLKDLENGTGQRLENEAFDSSEKQALPTTF